MRWLLPTATCLLLVACEPAPAIADARCARALEAAGRSVMRTPMGARTRHALDRIADLPCDAVPAPLRRAAREASAAPSSESQRRILADAGREAIPACAGVEGLDPNEPATRLLDGCLRGDADAGWLRNRRLPAGPALYAHALWRSLLAGGVVQASDGEPILLLELIKGSLHDAREETRAPPPPR